MCGKPNLFMVLDDEESIRHSIVSFLEDEGHTVLTAESAEKALELVRENPVTGVVVDIRLPGRDGNFFMVEASKIRPGMTFVVHTGSADYVPSDAVKALGVTCEQVLIKPVADLYNILNALVNPEKRSEAHD